MKSLKVLRLIVPILLINHCASSAKAQQQTNTVKEEYHIKMVLEENGSRKMIDTTFNSLEDLKKFQQQQNPQTHVEHNASRQWHHKVITEDIFIKNGDTSINKNIHVKKLTADDLKHLHEILNSKDFEGADIVTIMGMDSLPQGHELKVTAFLTFIDIETPTKEELKNSSNPELKKSTSEHGLEMKELNIYPNPTNGQLNLTFETGEAGKTQVLLTDIQGKEVYSEEINTISAQTVQRFIDIGGQASGTYFLKISSNNKSTVKKIILSETGQ